MDPSVEFGLRFETQETDDEDDEPDPEPPSKEAEVVRLDSFRK